MLADTLSTFTQHLDILPHEYLRRDLPSGCVIAITDTAASGLPTDNGVIPLKDFIAKEVIFWFSP